LITPDDPDRYVGYPELAAPTLHLAVTNLACPGQASGGFLSLSGNDNGCFAFRELPVFPSPLHAVYSGTQVDAAVAFLRRYRDTDLVTVMLGANDLLLCRNSTADGCASPSELSPVLTAYAAHLGTALADLRRVYRGRLEVVTYYSVDYSDPRTTLPVKRLNATAGAVARRYGAVIADGYGVFARSAARSGGRTCAAGLLIAAAGGVCDVHPSPAGARLLAGAVVAADRHRAAA
jgi:lysophospholipase L1-like esterase